MSGFLPPRRPTAFTLIEMIVVITIVLILVSVLAPVATSIQTSTRLTSTGQLIEAQLNLARTSAIARNRVVEVRFYKLPVRDNTNSVEYCAMQLYVRDEQNASTQAMTALQQFPSPMVLESNLQQFAPLLVGSTSTVTSLPPSSNLPTVFPAYGSAAWNYVGFAYKTDGSTDLALTASGTDTWFCMARVLRDVPASGQPPKNYYIVQVDPVTGRTTSFRP